MSNHTAAPTVLIRAARGSDGPALARLAALDSRRLPLGDLLVAESDGALVAAMAIGSGEQVADPFRRTADVLALLSLRAARLRAGATRAPRLRLVPRARTA